MPPTCHQIHIACEHVHHMWSQIGGRGAFPVILYIGFAHSTLEDALGGGWAAKTPTSNIEGIDPLNSSTNFLGGEKLSFTLDYPWSSASVPLFTPGTRLQEYSEARVEEPLGEVEARHSVAGCSWLLLAGSWAACVACSWVLPCCFWAALGCFWLRVGCAWAAPGLLLKPPPP